MEGNGIGKGTVNGKGREGGKDTGTNTQEGDAVVTGVLAEPYGPLVPFYLLPSLDGWGGRTYRAVAGPPPPWHLHSQGPDPAFAAVVATPAPATAVAAATELVAGAAATRAATAATDLSRWNQQQQPQQQQLQQGRQRQGQQQQQGQPGRCGSVVGKLLSRLAGPSSGSSTSTSGSSGTGSSKGGASPAPKPALTPLPMTPAPHLEPVAWEALAAVRRRLTERRSGQQPQPQTQTQTKGGEGGVGDGSGSAAGSTGAGAATAAATADDTATVAAVALLTQVRRHGYALVSFPAVALPLEVHVAALPRDTAGTAPPAGAAVANIGTAATTGTAVNNAATGTSTAGADAATAAGSPSSTTAAAAAAPAVPTNATVRAEVNTEQVVAAVTRQALAFFGGDGDGDGGGGGGGGGAACGAGTPAALRRRCYSRQGGDGHKFVGYSRQGARQWFQLRRYGGRVPYPAYDSWRAEGAAAAGGRRGAGGAAAAAGAVAAAAAVEGAAAGTGGRGQQAVAPRRQEEQATAGGATTTYACPAAGGGGGGGGDGGSGGGGGGGGGSGGGGSGGGGSGVADVATCSGNGTTTNDAPTSCTAAMPAGFEPPPGASTAAFEESFVQLFEICRTAAVMCLAGLAAGLAAEAAIGGGGGGSGGGGGPGQHQPAPAEAEAAAVAFFEWIETELLDPPNHLPWRPVAAQRLMTPGAATPAAAGAPEQAAVADAGGIASTAIEALQAAQGGSQDGHPEQAAEADPAPQSADPRAEAPGRPGSTSDAHSLEVFGSDVLRVYQYWRPAGAALPGLVDPATGLHADMGLVTVRAGRGGEAGWDGGGDGGCCERGCCEWGLSGALGHRGRGRGLGRVRRRGLEAGLMHASTGCAHLGLLLALLCPPLMPALGTRSCQEHRNIHWVWKMLGARAHARVLVGSITDSFNHPAPLTAALGPRGTQVAPLASLPGLVALRRSDGGAFVDVEGGLLAAAAAEAEAGPDAAGRRLFVVFPGAVVLRVFVMCTAT